MLWPTHLKVVFFSLGKKKKKIMGKNPYQISNVFDGPTAGVDRAPPAHGISDASGDKVESKNVYGSILFVLFFAGISRPPVPICGFFLLRLLYLLSYVSICSSSILGSSINETYLGSSLGFNYCCGGVASSCVVWCGGGRFLRFVCVPCGGA